MKKVLDLIDERIRPACSKTKVSTIVNRSLLLSFDIGNLYLIKGLNKQSGVIEPVVKLRIPNLAVNREQPKR